MINKFLVERFSEQSHCLDTGQVAVGLGDTIKGNQGKVIQSSRSGPGGGVVVICTSQKQQLLGHKG